MDGVNHVGPAGQPGAEQVPQLLPPAISGAAAARASGDVSPPAPATRPTVSRAPEVDDDDEGGVPIAGLLAALSSSEAVEAPSPQQAPSLPGQNALMAAGISAAGIGVGVAVGGPMGCFLAGVAGTLGLMRGLASLQMENQRLKEEVERLREEASTDPLTRLPNRRAVFERLEREARRCAVDGTTVGVILLDIDHFKRVNDTHGHPAGDEVLRVVAARLHANLRPGDTVGRYGGEEFLVLLPDGSLAAAREAAERLRLAVAREPVDIPFVAIPVTISLGVAVAGDIDAAIAAADAALYRAKAGGRNRVEI